MTDEEMAEEWAGWYWGASLSAKRAIKEAFLAGLKAGRPKWHKVADGDLPEAENYFWSRTVLLQTDKDSSIIGFYDHANKAWYEKATDDIVYDAIAWCEIPIEIKQLQEENERLKKDSEETQDLANIAYMQGASKYKTKLDEAKTIIQDLQSNSDEYARQRAMDFLKGE